MNEDLAEFQPNLNEVVFKQWKEDSFCFSLGETLSVPQLYPMGSMM